MSGPHPGYLPALPLTTARHDSPSPTTTPQGEFPLGIVSAADPVIAAADAAALSFTTANRLRVDSLGGSPGSGRDALHVLFTSGGLAGGTSTTTVHTATAARYTVITSVIARYTGTIAGVTLQLLAGTARGSIAVGPGLVSAVDIDLLAPGRVLYLDAAETLQVTVTGATATDTITVHVQGEEMTV